MKIARIVLCNPSPGRDRYARRASSAVFALGVCASLILTSPVALGQAFPSKSVRIISPYPPGGGNDLLSRAVASKLGPRLGQQAFVENKPGANSIIATEYVAKSPPDGYTIILIPSSHAINQSLYAKVPYDAVRDFTAISLAGTSPMMLAVPASSPYTNLRELIAGAAAKPGQLTYSTAGNGSTGHLVAVLLSLSTNIKLQHVPFKGTAPAVTGLLGSQVTMSMSPPALLVPHIRSGKLRALGVSGAERTATAPEVPTIAESGVPGFNATVWYGFLAPARTPKDVVDRLNADIVAVLKDADVVKVLKAQAIDPLTSTPEEFARLIVSEVDRWGKVVKESGARVE